MKLNVTPSQVTQLLGISIDLQDLLLEGVFTLDCNKRSGVKRHWDKALSKMRFMLKEIRASVDGDHDLADFFSKFYEMLNMLNLAFEVVCSKSLTLNDVNDFNEARKHVKSNFDIFERLLRSMHLEPVYASLARSGLWNWMKTKIFRLDEEYDQELRGYVTIFEDPSTLSLKEVPKYTLRG